MNISKSLGAAKSSVNRIPLCITDSKLGTEYERLAMNRKRVCNKQKRVWDSREELRTFSLKR